MLSVACVRWGEKYPPEYVTRLRDAVARHLSVPHRFVCLTNDPIEGVESIPVPEWLPGWWGKVYLFAPGLFSDRVLYLDLDVVVVGDLDRLAENAGIVSDWMLGGYNSSVMSWSPGQHEHVWTEFSPDAMRLYDGDQDWIRSRGPWPTYPEPWCVSYRLHATDGPPPGASVVCFHGEPKQNDVLADWIREAWGPPILRPVAFDQSMNTTAEVMLSQARENAQRGLPWLTERPEHGRSMAIVGGGPSLIDTLPKLSRMELDVFALNGAHDYLLDHGVIPTYHVLLDAREVNVRFVARPHPWVEYLVAAPCHPAVFDALRERERVTLWAPDLDGMAQATGAPLLVGGGATVGMKAMYLGYLLGYRRLHLFGMDSSYRAGAHHAYRQEWQDGVKPMTITAAGRNFVCAPWMAKQAQEFQRQARKLISLGCEVNVHGDGLLPHVARAMNGETAHADAAS